MKFLWAMYLSTNAIPVCRTLITFESPANPCLDEQIISGKSTFISIQSSFVISFLTILSTLC